MYLCSIIEDIERMVIKMDANTASLKIVAGSRNLPANDGKVRGHVNSDGYLTAPTAIMITKISANEPRELQQPTLFQMTKSW
jgi:hypothetical protein